ncbi:unnamed protein product [Peronospora destructor]|uniref:Tricarboxylate carrier n=1 Tax=Peronospora destructor TaxID=86335 RepID=A0AAV0T5B4_9STRA|nr:unnamed protein product [Peronospora destructor]
MTNKKDLLSIPDTQRKRADPNEDTYFGRYVTNAILHPDTGQPVFTPLRASMIVPMNMIMDGAMLLANSTRTTIVAQWFNQTYNALHYYANPNASNEDTTQQRLVAYVGATASSVGASLGIRRLVGRMKGDKWAPAAARMGPFAAVAAADLINMAVMRQSEYRNGVHVYDENGDHVGKSKRLCNSVFSAFRQTAQLNSKYLESRLQQATRKQDGQPVRVVTYNKGI